MKFKTFRALVIGAFCVAGCGGLVLLYSTCGGEQATQSTASAAAEPAKTSAPTQRPARPPITKTGTADAAPTGDGTELRPLDKQTIERMQQGFPGDKVKDAFKGPSKVSLYKDPDGTRRVKVDLDRDDKWDEKWTFETKDGVDKIKRQVSTNDDEKYDLEYRLDAGRWAIKK